ncbi:hypothetical protein Tco_1350173, partial [Tanacetum coccineum]
GKTGGFDQITNKYAIILYSLANRINIDYASIFWEDIIIKMNKRHREKVVPYTRFLSLLMMHKMKEGYGDGERTLYPTQVFSVNNWALKPNQHEEPPFTNHMLAICSADKPVVFKAPKLSSNAERVSQGTKPRAQPGHKKHSTSLKQPSVSNKEATKDGSSKAPTSSKTGHSKKRKEEDQQENGGPTSLGVTSEARSNPQLTSGMLAFNLNKPIYSASFIIHSESASGNDASAISIAKSDLKKSAPIKDEEAFSIIKLEDLAKLVSNVQPSFKYLDSPEDDPVINKAEAEAALLKSQPSFPNVGQLNELLVKSLQTEFSKILAAHDFSSSLPTKLKDLPSKFNELSKEVKGLKKQVHELEIKLPGDLKEIPTMLEDFIKTVTSLTSQVAKLNTLQWKLPAEFLSLPIQVASVQAKLKTLNALLGLLLNVTKALNKFAQVLDFASSKVGDQSVPLAGQADTMPAEGEKNINHATISQLFQRIAKKNAERENLNNQQPKPIPPIITTTTQMQSPL